LLMREHLASVAVKCAHSTRTNFQIFYALVSNSGKILVANANLVFEVPDPIADFGTLIVTHMNDDHMSITVAMVAAAISGLDVSEASITSVDRVKDS